MTEDPKVTQEKMLATIKKHENLVNLAKSINNLGKISEIVFKSLSDIILPQDKVHFCFYQLQTTGTPETGLKFYSCELNIITTRHFINLNFLQTTHNVNVKSIDHICDIDVVTGFGNPFDLDESIKAEDKSFVPSQVKFNLTFNDSKGNKVTDWDYESSSSETIDSLFSQVRGLYKLVGIPLLKV